MFEERVRTPAVREHVGAQICVAGWIHAIRSLSKVAFIVVRDGWGRVQVVVPPPELEALRRAGAGVGSVVTVRGRVAASAQASGGVELVEPSFTVVEPIAEPLPVPLGRALSQAGLATQLDHAATVLRDPQRAAVLRLAAAAAAGFRAVLEAQGFTEIHTPKIVGGATEGGANVFAVDYFGQRSFLAQSPQLYKQMMVGVFERVFEVGPVFRAEPHATVRHLAEYTSLDVEMGFIEGPTTVSDMLGVVLRGMLEHLRHRVPEAIATLGITLPRIPDPLPAITFAQARAELAEAGVGPLDAQDLAPAEERWLGAWALTNHGSDVLLVTGYPLAKRPFYTHPDPRTPGASASFDLLLRGTELVTGGQRLHRYADVAAAVARSGAEASAFAGYLEAFRHGMPPHGGFAIGLERFVAAVAELPNIRLARAFPRDVSRTQP